MRVNRELNIVVPIYGDEPQPVVGLDGKPKMENGKLVLEAPVIAYVHSTPLPEEAIDKYCVPLGQVFNAVMTGSMGIAGPGMALRILRNNCQAAGIWEGPQGVEKVIVEEMRRLSMALVPKDGGWESLPLNIAVANGHFSADDQKAVENNLIFFISAFVLPKHQRRPALEAAAEVCSGLLTSLNSTEYARSLKTSMQAVSSGETSPAPAQPAGGPANAVVDGKPASLPV